jgi:hypothetical protein
MKSEKINPEDINPEKTHAEKCFVSFESIEDIQKKNDIRRSSINKWNNALRENPYHPKDNELTLRVGPNDNSNNNFK